MGVETSARSKDVRALPDATSRLRYRTPQGWMRAIAIRKVSPTPSRSGVKRYRRLGNGPQHATTYSLGEHRAADPESGMQCVANRGQCRYQPSHGLSLMKLRKIRHSVRKTAGPDSVCPALQHRADAVCTANIDPEPAKAVSDHTTNSKLARNTDNRLQKRGTSQHTVGIISSRPANA
jgi:hypothetical protein